MPIAQYNGVCGCGCNEAIVADVDEIYYDSDLENWVLEDCREETESDEWEI